MPTVSNYILPQQLGKYSLVQRQAADASCQAERLTSPVIPFKTKQTLWMVCDRWQNLRLWIGPQHCTVKSHYGRYPQDHTFSTSRYSTFLFFLSTAQTRGCLNVKFHPSLEVGVDEDLRTITWPPNLHWAL